MNAKRDTVIVDGILCERVDVENGVELNIQLGSILHEAVGVLDYWTEENMRAAIQELEQRLRPGNGQHIAQFMHNDY